MTDYCPYWPELRERGYICISPWRCNECRLSPTQSFELMLETIQLEKAIWEGIEKRVMKP